ncbi:alpha/beta hydrolase [Leifsonia shinshuensis]|uniref:Pimeloyl-ACP methyl ester carboxylesterase n=1 Tax=Leifsonia shinshuensis TaxID=150026 RepID=A0A853CXU1_9MICO|nr:pimeloyl-ACP methyl ester carboxylesterase [Leifsonia shinshuensis]
MAGPMSGFLDRVRRALGLRRVPLLHIASDVGEGPVVVLVHGIASSSVTFQNLVPLLEPRHRAISIDILGFGRSPAPEDAQYTIEEHVAALDRTLRSLKLREPFVLVGHSLGSLIVARYAAERPGALSRLVLVGPPVYGTPAEIGDRRVRTRVSAYLRAYEFLRNNKEFTLRNANILGKLLPIKNVFEITEKSWRPFVLSLENCIERQTVIGDLARVHDVDGKSCPVEVVYGTMDAFIAPGSLAVIEAMRHVTMHRVEANDHLIRKRLARVVAAACDAGQSARDIEATTAR